MLLLGLMALLLTACATAPSKPVLPQIVDYSAASQERAAEEYDALPEGAELRRYVDDYGVLRAEIRAARGEFEGPR